MHANEVVLLTELLDGAGVFEPRGSDRGLIGRKRGVGDRRCVRGGTEFNVSKWTCLLVPMDSAIPFLILAHRRLQQYIDH